MSRTYHAAGPRPAGQAKADAPAAAPVDCNAAYSSFFGAHPEYMLPGAGMIDDRTGPDVTADGLAAYYAAYPSCAPTACAQALATLAGTMGQSSFPGQSPWLSSASIAAFVASNPTCASDPAVALARSQAATMEAMGASGSIGGSPLVQPLAAQAAVAPADMPGWVWAIGGALVATAVTAVVIGSQRRSR